jgi:Sec-independent protein translocase protein TatA
MQIFNIGPLELIFILVLALIVLGPENLVSTGKKLGQWVYKMVRSPIWASMVDTSREFREIPERIMRESGIQESMNEVQTLTNKINEEVNIPAIPVSSPSRPPNRKPARDGNTAESDPEK